MVEAEKSEQKQLPDITYHLFACFLSSFTQTHHGIVELTESRAETCHLNLNGFSTVVDNRRPRNQFHTTNLQMQARSFGLHI